MRPYYSSSRVPCRGSHVFFFGIPLLFLDLTLPPASPPRSRGLQRHLLSPSRGRARLLERSHAAMSSPFAPKSSKLKFYSDSTPKGSREHVDAIALLRLSMHPAGSPETHANKGARQKLWFSCSHRARSRFPQRQKGQNNVSKPM